MPSTRRASPLRCRPGGFCARGRELLSNGSAAPGSSDASRSSRSCVETLARVIRERRPQLVTVIGVPGIGKSRLVFELFGAIETGAFGVVYWRHGRSLPYGEGVTFWALGEIVKAQAGILESDSSERALEKLQQAVEQFVTDPVDAAWIEGHLRPLAGLETDDARGRPTR